jgi:hypothetical protein
MIVTSTVVLLCLAQTRIQEDACTVCTCSYKAVETYQPRTVICEGLGLREVPTNIPADTEILSLRDNRLTAVELGDFSHLSKLKVLKLSENDIKVLPIGCGSCKTVSIFKGIEALEELDVQDNLLEDEGIYDPKLNISTFTDLTQLKRLYLGKNKLAKIDPLTPLPALEVLNLEFNEMPKLAIPIDSINHLTTLTSLTIRGCLLEKDIPDFTPLSNLKILDLSYNRLKGGIPVTMATLTDLMHLDLTSNMLVDSIPAKITDLKKLESLQLGMNLFKGQVPDLSVITTLNQLYIHGVGNYDAKQCGEADSCGLSGILPSMPFSTMTGGCYLGGNVFACPLPADAATYCGATCV